MKINIQVLNVNLATRQMAVVHVNKIQLQNKMNANHVKGLHISSHKEYVLVPVQLALVYNINFF